MSNMTTNDFASLVLLTYHRPDYTERTLESLFAAKNQTPFELIVIDDGSRDANWTRLVQLLRERSLSFLGVNAGENLGVGVGINRGFGIARGRWLVKLDADLAFRDGWIDAGVELLERRSDIATVGFFDYHTYVPNDPRFNRMAPVLLDGVAKGWIVDDYVGSAFMLRRRDYLVHGIVDEEGVIEDGGMVGISHTPIWRGFEEGSAAFAEDVAWKKQMTDLGFQHAITAEDYISNYGFGVGNSTVVPALNPDGSAQVQKIANKPLLFGGARA